MSDNINENTNELHEEIDINEILMSCCGTDDEGSTMSGFSMDIGIYNPQTNEFDVKSSTVYCNPEIDIKRIGVTTMIDFIFNSRTDFELRKMWSLLQKYGTDCESAFRNNAKNTPLLRIQIVPIVYSGKYSVNAYSPIYWALQSQSPTGENNVIRTAFEATNVVIAENEMYDEEEIAARLEREDMERDRITQQYEARQQEEDDYKAEREERLEELRRNKEL